MQGTFAAGHRNEACPFGEAKRLQTTEIDRGFNFGSVASNGSTDDVDWYKRLRRLGAQSGNKSLIPQQWRVDTMRHLAERIEGLLNVGSEPGDWQLQIRCTACVFEYLDEIQRVGLRFLVGICCGDRDLLYVGS